MKEFPNLAIMASAGTGKTYSLAMRYITLLKLGVKPEEIVAMTFTNKAAGEIFDKIIQEILKMIASPAQLRSVIDAGSLPENTTREELFTILRKILCAPKKLQISTLDSFFFNIINAFPFECGIAGEITMLPENDDEQQVEPHVDDSRGSQKIEGTLGVAHGIVQGDVPVGQQHFVALLVGQVEAVVGDPVHLQGVVVACLQHGCAICW